MNYQQITFQVTLPSGAVATNPVELAYLSKLAEVRERPIVTTDGRVIVPPAAPPSHEDNAA
jgi:hypothetical protein